MATWIVVDDYVPFEMVITGSTGEGIEDESHGVVYRGLVKLAFSSDNK
jgi:hypothetical protein